MLAARFFPARISLRISLVMNLTCYCDRGIMNPPPSTIPRRDTVPIFRVPPFPAVTPDVSEAAALALSSQRPNHPLWDGPLLRAVVTVSKKYLLCDDWETLSSSDVSQETPQVSALSRKQWRHVLQKDSLWWLQPDGSHWNPAVLVTVRQSEFNGMKHKEQIKN